MYTYISIEGYDVDSFKPSTQNTYHFFSISGSCFVQYGLTAVISCLQLMEGKPKHLIATYVDFLQDFSIKTRNFAHVCVCVCVCVIPFKQLFKFKVNIIKPH